MLSESLSSTDGELHTARGHHQGLLHGLLLARCQAARLALHPQPLWQWESAGLGEVSWAPPRPACPDAALCGPLFPFLMLGPSEPLVPHYKWLCRVPLAERVTLCWVETEGSEVPPVTSCLPPSSCSNRVTGVYELSLCHVADAGSPGRHLPWLSSPGLCRFPFRTQGG